MIAAAVRYLASGDAHYDQLVVERCPLCSFPHRHLAFEASVDTFERSPGCRKSTTLHGGGHQGRAGRAPAPPAIPVGGMTEKQLTDETCFACQEPDPCVSPNYPICNRCGGSTTRRCMATAWRSMTTTIGSSGAAT